MRHVALVLLILLTLAAWMGVGIGPVSRPLCLAPFERSLKHVPTGAQDILAHLAELASAFLTSNAYAQSDVILTTQPTSYSWTASEGATYYKFELYKDRVLGQLVTGTSGHTNLPYWYNASRTGSVVADYDVDCSTNPGTCTLPWMAITNNATVDLSTVSSAAHTGPGTYEWVITPWAAGPGTPVSSTFYLNNGTNPPPPKPTLFCPGQIMPTDVIYGRAGACNITSSNPTFRWNDVANGANDAYEIYYGPITSSIANYFHAYILRNSSVMYAGPTLSVQPVDAYGCDGTTCTAATGTTAVTSSILLSPGTYKWYLRGLNRDTSGALQFTGVWGNNTLVLSPDKLTPPANLFTNTLTNEAFYPKFQWVRGTNASWHNVELTAKPLLSAAAVTKNAWLPSARICNASLECQVGPDQVDTTFAYGVNPSAITWKVTPFNAEVTPTYTTLAQIGYYNGSPLAPTVPRANSPTTLANGIWNFSWNATTGSGSASYVEMYIFRYPFTSPFTWLYHEYMPIDPSNYPPTSGAGTRKGVLFSGPAARCTPITPNWACSALVPDANMTKGDATDTNWGHGVYGWAIRAVNPIGYNPGTGLEQWGIGYFSK